ncbi:MAG: replication protein RepA [Acidobacteriota bacterium]|nr:replication protein RepA [Acidobacteriota bacterium]
MAHRHQLWWSPRDPDQQPLWNSVVVLSAEFYDELVAHAVPIDLRALKALADYGRLRDFKRRFLRSFGGIGSEFKKHLSSRTMVVP